MAKSKSIIAKLESKLIGPSIQIPDMNLDSVIESRLTPGAFPTQASFRKHLTEGSVLNITTLASRYIGIPGGEYVVFNVNDSMTTLFPTGVQNEDLAKPVTPTEVHTSRLVGNWDKMRRSLVEFDMQSQEQPSDQAQGKKERIQKSHSKYPRNQQVKGAIEASGKSQEEIADAIGVDPSTVSRWTARSGEGARLPSLEKAIALSKGAGVDIEAMFGGISSTTPRHSKQKKTSGSGGGRNATYSSGNTSS